jgi:hypothetical protein
MAAARAFGRPPVRSSGAPLMMLSNAGRAGPLDSMEQRMRLSGRARSGGHGGALRRQHLRFSTGTSGLCVRIAADGRWIWSSPGRSGQGMKPDAWCPHRKSDRGRTSPFRGEGRKVWNRRVAAVHWHRGEGPLATPSGPLAQVPSVRFHPLVGPLAGADSTQRRLVLDPLR